MSAHRQGVQFESCEYGWRDTSSQSLPLFTFTKKFVLLHKIVQYLINKGAPTDFRDHDGSTLLHVAASNSDEDSLCLVECLVNNKADVNAQNHKGETPLHLAHEADVIAFLRKKGATIDVRDIFGSTPLHFAASRDSLLLVECLVTNKADVNVKNLKGESPLHLAQKADVADFLLKNGAAIDVQDLSGSTPLHVAASKDDLLSVKFLVDNKADVNVQNMKGETPLHLARKAYVADFLLKNGATIDVQDNLGSTQLHVAAPSDSLPLVECLVNNMADINAQNLKVETPLYLACKAEVAKFLLKRRATIDVGDIFGSTPLHVAASKDDLLLVQCLADNKADVNAQNMKGETPLHLAHKPDVIDFLLRSGANNQSQDINGKTPSDNFELN